MIAIDTTSVAALYAEYADALDEDRLDDWLTLFTDDCLYQAIARENYDRGLPLATMRCESRGMLADRVTAIRSTSMYAPRTLRHLIDTPRVRDGGRVEANFVVMQTLVGEPTTLFSAGRYHDVVVESAAGLLFSQKIAVYDSALVPNSLIYPL